MYFFKGPPKSPQSRPEEKRRAPIKGSCFAEKANGMIAALIVFCAIVLFASTTTTVQHYEERRAQARKIINDHPATPAAQTVGFNPCPYCRGMLDKLRRCNIRGCALFSPHWGKAAQPAAAAVRAKPEVIREMAMEVAAVPGFEGVAVHAVYEKGWAAQAGLKPGDLLVKFDGRGIDNVKDFQDLVIRAVPETPVNVEFLRGATMLSTKVTIGEGEMEGAVQPVHWGFRM